MAEVLGGPAGSPGTPGEHAPARDDAARAVTALFRDHHLELVRLAQPEDGGPGAADVGEAASDRGELAAALRGLPGRQREVLVLRFYLDLDAAGIAAVLRISQSAVRSTTSRGLAALARILGEEAER
jgi:RNA polymerase sigma factor (sigma-70 family)